MADPHSSDEVLAGHSFAADLLQRRRLASSGCVLGDTAYGTRVNHDGARQYGICPVLAYQREPHGSGLGSFRSVSSSQ